MKCLFQWRTIGKTKPHEDKIDMFYHRLFDIVLLLHDGDKLAARVVLMPSLSDQVLSDQTNVPKQTVPQVIKL